MNTLHICKTCKWWGSSNDAPSRYNPIWRTCNSPNLIRGYGNLEGWEGRIQVENDEGWGIATSPIFGCILWEKK